MSECLRCNHEMIDNGESEYFDEIPNKSYDCPHCGTHVEVYLPTDEEEKQNLPMYNKELEEEFGDSSHGYEGFCPECGHHIIWQSDFMRSEVVCDVDESVVDEYGIPVDDALVSNVYCPYCGAMIEIIEPKPSDIEKNDYPYWKELKNRE